MKKRINSGTKLFLTELMIAIFFFAVIAAVCTQAFSEAHAMSRKSEQLVQGVNVAANAAEYFMVWDGERESFQEMFETGIWEADCFQMEFDDNWQPVSKEGVYTLSMTLLNENGLQKAEIAVRERETETVIYELEVARGR